MPLVKTTPEDERLVPYAAFGSTEPDALAEATSPKDPGIGAEAMAFYRRETAVGSALQRVAANLAIPDDTPAPADWSPFDMVEGTEYESEWDRFIDDKTPAQVQRRMALLDQERADTETLATGGGSVLPVAIAMGLVDPVNMIPVGAVLSSARIARRAGALAVAGRAVAAGAVSQGIEEIGLQATQESRTLAESALNVSAGAVLSGLLGGAVAAMPRAKVRNALATIAKHWEMEDTVSPVVMAKGEVAGSSGAPIDLPALAKLDESEATPEVAFGYGLPTVWAKMRGSKTANLLTFSQSPHAKRTMFRLLDTGIINESAPEYTSAQSILENLEGVKHQIGVESDTAYRTYLKRAAGIGSARARVQEALDATQAIVKKPKRSYMTREEFEEAVGLAIRGADPKEKIFGIRGVHEIPAEAHAIAKMHNEFYEAAAERAVKAGLLPEEVLTQGPKYAANYLRRVYDRKRITDWIDPTTGKTVFHGRVKRHLLRSYKNEQPVSGGLPGPLRELELQRIAKEIDAAADDAAMQIQRHILRHDAHFDPLTPIPIQNPVFKERVLAMPDEEIADFLDNHAGRQLDRYNALVMPEIALRESFAETGGTIDDALVRVHQEYEIQRAELSQKYAGKPDSKAFRSALDKLDKREKLDIAQLNNAVEAVRGTLGRPMNENWRATTSALRLARAMNVWTKLGGAVFSSMYPDAAMGVLRLGLRKPAQTLLRDMTNGFRAFKGSKKELLRSAIGIEFGGGRAESLAEIGRDAANKMDELSAKIGSAATRINLLTPWTQLIKRFYGPIVLDDLRLLVGKVARGEALRGRQAMDAKFLRIGPKMAARIQAQIEAHGFEEHSGLGIVDSSMWTDEAAALAWRSMARRGMNNLVLTPGRGDRPLLLDYEVGKTLGQFKTYAMMATERILVQGAQRAAGGEKAGQVMGMTALLTAGLMVEQSKRIIANRELLDPEKNWDDALIAGVDRSGMLGYVSEVGTLFGKAGYGPWKSGTTRYASSNFMSTALGPLFGNAEDAVNAAQMFREGASVSRLESLERLLSPSSLFYLRWALGGESISAAIGPAMGLPQKARAAR